jgi:hypothetical protein
MANSALSGTLKSTRTNAFSPAKEKEEKELMIFFLKEKWLPVSSHYLNFT